MKANKLAVVGKVIETHQIEGADFIKQAIVVCGDAGKWSGVVGLTIQVGDLVTVFLQDAVLPPNPAWAFMERFGWRVRMARFKGCPSECVILPLEVEDGSEPAEVGTDLTNWLGVTKHSKPIPESMTGVAAGDFPFFIPKTDEPNFQTVHDFTGLMERQAMVARVKYDGTSCTVWNDEDGMHVASRNLELKEFSPSGASNAYWRVARMYDMSKIPAGCALQFEVIGPGIQGNPLGLTELEGRAFTLHDYKLHQRCGDADLEAACENIGIPIAHPAFRLTEGCVLDADDLRAMAQIKYPNGRHGEGLVFRSLDGLVSFKTINLLYKERD